LEAFTGMGAPLPALSAIFATVAEVGGGLLLLIGAITFVHAKNGFAVGEGGVEWPLALLAMGLAVALAGPGRFSAGGKA
jgi:putative oxidoreductase